MLRMIFRVFISCYLPEPVHPGGDSKEGQGVDDHGCKVKEVKMIKEWL